MYFDTSTVLAGGLGVVITFLLFRGYAMWRRWSNTSKVNDEIDMDKKISDAIKMGDVETIARLRKYFLTYKRDGAPLSAFVIYDWDKNRDPNEVEIDSVWLTEENAKKRMATIHSQLTAKCGADSEFCKVELTEIEGKARDANIRFFKRGESKWDSTRGIFCNEVSLDNSDLLELDVSK